jgi:hypothetical protein
MEAVACQRILALQELDPSHLRHDDDSASHPAVRAGAAADRVEAVAERRLETHRAAMALAGLNVRVAHHFLPVSLTETDPSTNVSLEFEPDNSKKRADDVRKTHAKTRLELNRSSVSARIPDAAPIRTFHVRTNVTCIKQRNVNVSLDREIRQFLIAVEGRRTHRIKCILLSPGSHAIAKW